MNFTPLSRLNTNIYATNISPSNIPENPTTLKTETGMEDPINPTKYTRTIPTIMVNLELDVP